MRREGEASIALAFEEGGQPGAQHTLRAASAEEAAEWLKLLVSAAPPHATADDSALQGLRHEGTVRALEAGYVAQEAPQSLTQVAPPAPRAHRGEG